MFKIVAVIGWPFSTSDFTGLKPRIEAVDTVHRKHVEFWRNFAGNIVQVRFLFVCLFVCDWPMDQPDPGSAWSPNLVNGHLTRTWHPVSGAIPDRHSDWPRKPNQCPLLPQEAGDNNCSSTFTVSNGLKQGGILSPILYCVYMDSFLLKLKSRYFSSDIKKIPLCAARRFAFILQPADRF